VKSEYINGNLSVNLGEVLECLTLDEKLEIIEMLSCMDDVIKHVSDQILEGWTEGCSHGATGVGATFTTPLDKARFEVAKRSSASAKYIIERLEQSAIFEHAMCEQYRDWAIKMSHILFDNGLKCPPSPKISERKGYKIMLDETSTSKDV
jgi:hypothetical protein